MKINLSFSDCVHNDLMNHFVNSPFLIQAAFLLTSVEVTRPEVNVRCEEFIRLADKECEYVSSDCMVINAEAVLKTVKAASKKNQSFIYIRSSPKTSSIQFNLSSDELMIFRIAYAYNPHGLHIIVYVKENRLKGYAVLPDYTSVPVSLLLPSSNEQLSS